MGELSPWHWAIIAVVVLLLFGTKKLPDAARSLGRSLRIMKTELKTLHDEEPAVGDVTASQEQEQTQEHTQEPEQAAVPAQPPRDVVTR